MSNNKIWVPMTVGAGIGFLGRKTAQATVIGGLTGIGVGIVMNVLGFDPGLSAPAGIARREEHARETRLPDFDFETIPYTGRVKYY